MSTRAEVVASAALVLVWCGLAIGMSLMLSAEAHEFYTGQTSPGRHLPCCNERDCAPREVRLDQATMAMEILLNDRWWPAEDSRWFLGASPDGSWHGCMMPNDPLPRCVWGGAGA